MLVNAPGCAGVQVAEAIVVGAWHRKRAGAILEEDVDVLPARTQRLAGSSRHIDTPEPATRLSIRQGIMDAGCAGAGIREPQRAGCAAGDAGRLNPAFLDVCERAGWCRLITHRPREILQEPTRRSGTGRAAAARAQCGREMDESFAQSSGAGLRVIRNSFGRRAAVKPLRIGARKHSTFSSLQAPRACALALFSSW